MLGCLAEVQFVVFFATGSIQSEVAQHCRVSIHEPVYTLDLATRFV